MNKFCKKLNLPTKFTPNINFSQWDTEGLSWVQFHKVLQPKELNNNHLKLKNEIEINQKNYEKLIDEAANEISSFVEKANLENLS